MPYLGILFWLLYRGLTWVAQVLLAPLVMGSLGRDDLLACYAGIPQQPPQVIIGADIGFDTVERLPEQPWLLNTCVQADQRDQLVRFWLAAPEDLLPSLWSSPVGEATKSLVRALTPQTSFTAEQVATRDAIGARLQAGFEGPMAIQLCLQISCTPHRGCFPLPTRILSFLSG